MTVFQLFRIWFLIGLQSFGGGSATRYLIWQASVTRYHWVTEHEFTRYWAICHISPGINLLALVTLIGWRIRRLPGILICLFGLLLPSISITIIITAIYASIRESSTVQGALHGVVPATVGLGIIMVWRLFEPIWMEVRRESLVSVLIGGGLIVASLVLTALKATPIMVILLGGGAIGALSEWWFHRHRVHRPPHLPHHQPPTSNH